MQKVYKYTLSAKQEQEIRIPEGYKVIKFISAEEQRGEIVVYALIDDVFNHYGPETFRFYVIGTGHESFIDLKKCQFLGTVKLDKGYLMFHVFCSNVG